MKRLTISVVIDHYNNGAFLRECIESVLAQTRQADEIIIVDDGSTDNSRKIIEEYVNKNVTVKAIYQENKGQLSAVSTGILSSSGDLLFFLDGDDCYKPTHLESLEKHWMNYPNVDLIYCRHERAGSELLVKKYHDEHAKGLLSLLGPVKNILEPYEWGCTATLAAFYPYCFLGNITCALSIKRRHAVALNLEEIIKKSYMPLLHADYALLLLSALRLGKKLYVPDVTVLHRMHENSTTIKASEEPQKNHYNHYKRLISMALIKHLCLENFPLSFDLSILQAEIKTIPNPSQGHLALYNAVCIAQHPTQQLEDKLQDVYNSKSWKLTKPLRMCNDFVLSLLTK